MGCISVFIRCLSTLTSLGQLLTIGGVVFEVHDSLNNHITGWVRDAPKFECSAWATEAEEPSLEGRNVEIALIENVLGI
jgi:hypothetical protein